MLISLGTQLARARRQRIVVPVFPVTTPDIAHTVLDSAARIAKDVILQVNVGDFPAITIDDLRGELIPYARRLSIHVSFLASLETASELPEIAYMYEAVNLSSNPSANLEAVPFFHSMPSPVELQPYLHKIGAVAFGLTVGQAVVPEAADLLRYIESVTSVCKLPAVIRGIHPGFSLKKKLVRSGVSGVILTDELDSAFTGGLRTSLRDWSAGIPAVYMKKALTAVENYVVTQLRSPLEP